MYKYKKGTTDRSIIVASAEARILTEAETAFTPYFNVFMAEKIDDVINAIGKQTVAAIIICIGDKRDDAFSLFHGIYDCAEEKHIPILFLAEHGNDEDEKAAFEGGAADYTVKRPGTLTALAIRINLRIHASEYERQVLSAGLFSRLPSA